MEKVFINILLQRFLDRTSPHQELLYTKQQQNLNYKTYGLVKIVRYIFLKSSGIWINLDKTKSDKALKMQKSIHQAR